MREKGKKKVGTGARSAAAGVQAFAVKQKGVHERIRVKEGTARSATFRVSQRAKARPIKGHRRQARPHRDRPSCLSLHYPPLVAHPCRDRPPSNPSFW